MGYMVNLLTINRFYTQTLWKKIEVQFYQLISDQTRASDRQSTIITFVVNCFTQSINDKKGNFCQANDDSSGNFSGKTW